MSLQIKCLLELNCVCPVPFNAARAFVALGSWLWWKVPNMCAVKGCYEKDLLLTVVGVEPKERESPVELFFIMDATRPQGAAAVRWNRINSSLSKFLQLICFECSFVCIVNIVSFSIMSHNKLCKQPHTFYRAWRSY